MVEAWNLAAAAAASSSSMMAYAPKRSSASTLSLSMVSRPDSESPPSSAAPASKRLDTPPESNTACDRPSLRLARLNISASYVRAVTRR